MLNFGGLTLTPTTFLSVDHSSPFFRTIGEALYLITQYSDFRYSDPFRTYSLSMSKVIVKNRAKFWMFFALPNFVGAPLSKFLSMLSPMTRATSPGEVT